MKVVHLNETDISGGAGRAAYRIHSALKKQGIDSRMWVLESRSGDETVSDFRNTSALAQLGQSVKNSISRRLTRLMKTGNRNLHTPAIWNSEWPERVNSSDADIVHLHWVSGRMLSVTDIGRIKKPLVWTLHDMWAFCGAEHYTESARWKEGYSRGNRPEMESGFDLNRWTWRRKRRHWTSPMTIVTPSTWLGECAKQSALMHEWPVQTIPNCLDLTCWKPVEKSVARTLFNLPENAPLVLFGALGGREASRKGMDLLLQACDHLRETRPDAELVIFGQSEPIEPPNLGFRIHYVGHLSDDLSLQAIYSAADAFVLPSRQDNLPNTGIEAHACGTPIVGFRIGGIADIVDHGETGYLAEPFDTRELSDGIRWVLNPDRAEELRVKARKRAEARFAGRVVASRYSEQYRAAIERRGLT